MKRRSSLRSSAAFLPLFFIARRRYTDFFPPDDAVTMRVKLRPMTHTSSESSAAASAVVTAKAAAPPVHARPI